MPNTDSYSGKTVLVTGAAGFIGSHLSDALLHRGATVIGIDNFITGREENLLDAKKSPSFTFIQADAIDSPQAYLPKGKHIDSIFHLASPASPPRYQEHPVETYLVNAFGTHNLLQYLLAENQEGRLVYTSSSEVYGDAKVDPQNEEYWGNVNPNGARSCYDESKRMGETICGVHTRDFGLDVRIARIFNTYGPRMDPKDGRLLPNLFTQALKNEPLTVYGDGTQTRSFCYVDDLVAGLLLLGSVGKASGQTINLGNPTEKTVLEMVDIIRKLTNNTKKPKHSPLPEDDPKQRRPDISKAKRLLGWEPHINLDDGLSRALEYFKTVV